jgi:hypothetical protein
MVVFSTNLPLKIPLCRGYFSTNGRFPWHSMAVYQSLLASSSTTPHLDAAGCVGVGGVTAAVAAWKKLGLYIGLVGLRSFNPVKNKQTGNQ